MKAIKIILVSLMIVALVGGILGTVSFVSANGTKTINVKQASLDFWQSSCPWGIASWHFVITRIADPSLAPAKISVTWDTLPPTTADVPIYLPVTGGTAHYYAYANAGYKVTDATAVIYDTWDGEFNLSHVVCQDSVCPIGPAAYRWSPGIGHPKGYLWNPYPTTFKSWNQVSFTNNGSAMIYNVTATITCKPVNVTVVDGTVNIGNIPAGGSAWSTDDFALVTDMTNPQDPGKMFVWKVEYDDAAGYHHVIFNVPKYCGEPVNCP